MPLRINKMTTNVQITGQQTGSSPKEIGNIVDLVYLKIKEEMEYQERLSDENKIIGGVSEIEPY